MKPNPSRFGHFWRDAEPFQVLDDFLSWKSPRNAARFQYAGLDLAPQPKAGLAKENDLLILALVASTLTRRDRSLAVFAREDVMSPPRTR
jgi:hypothetical protein